MDARVEKKKHWSTRLENVVLLAVIVVGLDCLIDRFNKNALKRLL